MSVISISETLDGWAEDLDGIVPVLPAQRKAILKAYHSAVTVGGIRPGDNAAIEQYINENATGKTGGRAIVKKFLVSFEKMAKSGQIPYGEYDPSKSALSQIMTATTAASKFGQGMLTRVAIIAGIGLVGYLLVTGQIRLPKGKDR